MDITFNLVRLAVVMVLALALALHCSICTSIRLAVDVTIPTSIAAVDIIPAIFLLKE